MPLRGGRLWNGLEPRFLAKLGNARLHQPFVLRVCHALRQEAQQVVTDEAKRRILEMRELPEPSRVQLHGPHPRMPQGHVAPKLSDTVNCATLQLMVRSKTVCSRHRAYSAKARR